MTKPISTTTTNQPDEMAKVKCHKCGYEWETSSTKVMVTCPSCMTKTPLIKKGDKK